jgi:capsular polysaccharide transport system permease protein
MTVDVKPDQGAIPVSPAAGASGASAQRPPAPAPNSAPSNTPSQQQWPAAAAGGVAQKGQPGKPPSAPGGLVQKGQPGKPPGVPAGNAAPPGGRGPQPPAAAANRQLKPAGAVGAPAKTAPAHVPKPSETIVTLSSDVLRLDAVRLLRKQRNAFLLRVLAFVIGPTVAAALYVYVYATPRYVSEFQVVYVPTQSQSLSLSASSLIGGLLGGTSTIDYTKVIGTYIISPAALEIVDAKLDLRKKFSDPRIDWWNRMPVDASNEKFLTYFLNRVTYWEQTGGFLTVDVEGFNPADAKELAQALLDAADKMVAGMNDRPLLDMVEFTKKEKDNYEQSMNKATDVITAFREAHYDYDFTATVASLSSVVGGLQGQVAQARSELASVRGFLGDSAPSVIALKAKIAALQGQIEDEQNHLASPAATGEGVAGANAAKPQRGGLVYSQVMADYLNLLATQQFAVSAYVYAEKAYESAKLAAAEQPAYAISFVPPNLPQYSTSPAPTQTILTTFLIALIAYSLGSLVISMARDHSGL